MRSIKSLIGMPVILSGKKLGRVSSVRADDALRELRGLYLSCGVTGSRYIECAQLDMIGDVAILTHGAGRRSSSGERPLLRRALSTDGQRLGAITDAIIDEDTLRIDALELSRGYLDDLTHGRKRVRQFSVCKNGDVIVGPSEGGNEE